MAEFAITLSRPLPQSSDPESPHFDNPPESQLMTTVRAATEEGATRKAIAQLVVLGMLTEDEAPSWSLKSAINNDLDDD